MKVLLVALIALNLFANKIVLENCSLKELEFSKIPKKMYKKIYIQAPFDKQKNHYTGITLNDLHKIVGNPKKITFLAYDDYKVTFNLDEIKKPYIYFVFLIDNHPIPLSKRGPAKIIYTKKDKNKNYFFKSIFLIKKAICEQ